MKNKILTGKHMVGSSFNPVEIPRENMEKLPIIEKTNHAWGTYKEYNENINTHPEYIDKFYPRDNHVLIRAFKYEGEAKTDSGLLLNNDVEWYDTDGGQRKMRTSVNPYQQRAILVKVGYLGGDNGFYNKLEEGTIVTLSTNKLDNCIFDTDPTVKGKSEKGYFLIHVGFLTGIEL